MFDYIEVIHPLPDDHNSLLFQTKSLYCMMESYTITAAGRLIRHDVEYEATPDDELPYKDDPNPLMRMCGSIRPKPGTERDVDCDYHGYINLYDCKGKPREPGWEWIEYQAKFTDGTLVSIERVRVDDGE